MNEDTFLFINKMTERKRNRTIEITIENQAEQEETFQHLFLHISSHIQCAHIYPISAPHSWLSSMKDRNHLHALKCEQDN